MKNKITHDFVIRTHRECPKCKHKTICYRDFNNTRLYFCSRIVCNFLTGIPNSNRSWFARAVSMLNVHISKKLKLELNQELKLMMETIDAKVSGLPVPGYGRVRLEEIKDSFNLS